MRGKVAKALRKVAENSQAKPNKRMRNDKTGQEVVLGKRRLYQNLKRAWHTREQQ